MGKQYNFVQNLLTIGKMIYILLNMGQIFVISTRFLISWMVFQRVIRLLMWAWRVCMKCPFCASEDTRVIDSRPADDNNSIRRRRLCDVCGKRFTTYEKVETIPLIIIPALTPAGWWKTCFAAMCAPCLWGRSASAPCSICRAASWTPCRFCAPERITTGWS